MEWNEKLQKIIDCVENHLQRKEEPVDIDEISKIAGCSFSFFQKVFSYLNGISFAEYIRFRKLTMAGYDLKSTNALVVDISYKYGYDSPTSFTKAFQQFHGITPKEARNENAKLRVYPKMQISFKQKYTWCLEQKNSFRLIGKSTVISCEDNGQQERILEFWNQCQRDGTFAKLISIDNANPSGVFGVCGGYDREKKKMYYAIMVASDKECQQGFEELMLPEVTWAVFNCRGALPNAIQNGWKYLQEEWLIKYPFQHAKCPELEWYSSGNTFDKDYFSQIWIPIIEVGDCETHKLQEFSAQYKYLD